ncbi:hypothetical protein [Primorskyibacter marinus]|uniref:hypothetical protein n=1 Tax=Primorskyibacter marinus TaxID=1977320 RepID=UPI000E3082C6|nr:hypothetical protein [Primorskyibacter marinus]
MIAGMVYLIPAFSLMTTLIVAHVVVRGRRGWIAAAMAGLALTGMVWGIWQGRQQVGWDGIGYTIFAVLMMAPAVIGTALGALIAWWRFRRGATVD